ncbi:MAG: ATP-binding protein [Acidilobaceae archaeon]
MECAVCGRRGEVLQAYRGRVLCRECFVNDVRERVRREAERWRLVEPGDTLLLAVSGGKDSFVLLDTLPRAFGESRFIAFTIVEGIPGYNRLSDVEALADHAREVGVDFVKASFKEYLGLSLGEIVEKASRLELEHSPCTYCGVARRHMMVRAAEELGARKIATAHVLDDEIQTLLINIMRGDWRGVLKLHPASWRRERGPVRVKPLRKVYEWEAALYAYLRGYRFQEVECPYITLHPTLRARVRARLLEVEKRKPGLLMGMLEFLDELLEEEASRLKEAPLKCPLCGAPASAKRGSCRLCELLGELGVVGLYRSLGGGVFKVGSLA